MMPCVPGVLGGRRNVATFRIVRASGPVLAVAAFGWLVSAGWAGAASPRLADPHPCRGARAFTCSTLVVPLDRAGRRPGSLGLQVAAADDVAAPRGVLLFLTGGPGEPGVPFVARVARTLGGVLDGYRLVVLDQRGTGAGALECPALQREMGSSDLYPPSAGAVRACGSALGASRAFFGTDDVVADLELLRRALGAEKWTLDGVSYGTFVAERYAVAHPGRVRRLVLDSVVPQNAGYALFPVELHAVGRVLRAACSAPACPTDPAADLAAVVRREHGPQLLDALTSISIVDPTFRRVFDVPALLRRARDGDPAALDGLLRTVRGWEAYPASALSQGLHASALCADWRFPWGGSDAPLATRGALLAAAVRKAAPGELWPFDRATAAGNGFEQQCLPWPPTEPTPLVAARLPDVPTLLLAGDRDLSTPVEWARREAGLAPAGRLVVVPGAGHDVQLRARSNLGRDALAAFLGR
jgi:pimeloyl-ACP methyl ester carboxylesterase